MKVVLRRRALQDLIEIAAYIAQDNPVAADHFVDALEQRARSLDRFPNRGRDESLVSPGLRALRHDDYLILYIVEDEIVSVLRFVHGARNLEDIIEGYE